MYYNIFSVSLLYWVGTMNAIKNQAEKQVEKEDRQRDYDLEQ